MDKVIPTSLNYADVKSEAIENMVKLVRFTPTANVTNSQPNDVVRFNLQSNGFYDPYSAYIMMEVDFNPVDAQGINTAGGDIMHGKLLDRSAHSFIQRMIIRSQSTELERVEQYDVMAAMINDMIYSTEQKRIRCTEGFPCDEIRQTDAEGVTCPTILTNCGDDGFLIQQTDLNGQIGLPGALRNVDGAIEADIRIGPQSAADSVQVVDVFSKQDPVPLVSGVPNGAGGVDFQPTPIGIANRACVRKFCIPIYSGLIGVLMPDKKLLPLSLLPLEIEFSLNPYALYGLGAVQNRRYVVKKFDIYAHMLFFEQEVHRSLEQVVAQQGIFIHFNTFYLAPITVNSGAAGQNIDQYASINVHFKSINAVHFVFMYSGFESNVTQRKLHFVSHKLTKLQIRNGTELLPSEPIDGDMSQAVQKNYSQFLIEMYKGWNKMHDPSTDTALTQLTYPVDELTDAVSVAYGAQVPIGATLMTNNYSRVANIPELFLKQASLGRCQYAISMEGEELGKDKSTITGRKGLMPFDINMIGTKPAVPTSNVVIFVRADMVVFVRPDLVVTTLGR